MNKLLGITGWVVAAIAVTALVGYIHYSDKLIDQAEQVRVAHTKTELKLSETLLQLEQSIETARETPTIEQVDALEKSLAFANHEIAQLKAASENDEQTRLMADAEADLKKPARRGSFMTAMMAEIIGNEELMASQAKMSVSMQYSSLLRDLQLPDEALAQMKDILAQAAIDSLKLRSGKARSGGETNSNQRKNTDWVRQELSKILSADELVVWEEFEANKATHMIEQQYDMQLGMFAVGLTAENRTMVRDVMVDETLLLQQAQLDDDVLTMESRLKAHMEIFQNARQRLFPLLDTDQYRVAEAFIEQQEAGLRIGMQMMDDMFGDEEGADIAEEL